MSVFRYSRWDGTRKEFTLDNKSALDAMSELMMEGLSAQEALEWMQRMGFELAGLNMRVMGLDEIQMELREALRDLFNQYSMDEALPEMEERLNEILDRELAVQRRGAESAPENDARTDHPSQAAQALPRQDAQPLEPEPVGLDRAAQRPVGRALKGVLVASVIVDGRVG